MAIGYNPKKAAQVLAFLVRGRGGRTEFIDVIKLAYLSDREFLSRYDRPILYDDFYCLDHGPVDLRTYDAIKEKDRLDKPWSDYLQARSGDHISLKEGVGEDDFDELSAAEEAVMSGVLQQQKQRFGIELVDWMHEHCREWTNLRGTSIPLPYLDVFKALGKRNPELMNEHIEEMRHIALSLSV